jgi:hypothetical protein
MNKPTFIQCPDEIVGKTVRQVISRLWDNELFIQFADGTVLAVTMYHDKYDEPEYHITLSDGEASLSNADLVQLGYMTQEEADQARAGFQTKRDEAAKAQRLAQWRQLDKEFHGTPPELCGCGFCTTHGQGACKTGKYHMKTGG